MLFFKFLANSFLPRVVFWVWSKCLSFGQPTFLLHSGVTSSINMAPALIPTIMGCLNPFLMYWGLAQGEGFGFSCYSFLLLLSITSPLPLFLMADNFSLPEVFYFLTASKLHSLIALMYERFLLKVGRKLNIKHCTVQTATLTKILDIIILKFFGFLAVCLRALPSILLALQNLSHFLLSLILPPPPSFFLRDN